MKLAEQVSCSPVNEEEAGTLHGSVAWCWVSTVYSVGALWSFRIDPKGDLFLLLQGHEVPVTDPTGWIP